MLKNWKIQLSFWAFVVAITLGVIFLVFSPPYSANFFINLGFIILAESLILLLPLDFQSEVWSIRILFIGSGAILYAVLVALVSALGVFHMSFNVLLALHLLILLIPGIGMTAAALLRKQMFNAVEDIKNRRKLFEELYSKASFFDVELKTKGSPELVKIFSSVLAKISTMPKETSSGTEDLMRQIIAELDSVIRDHTSMEPADFSKRIGALIALIELRNSRELASN